MKAGHDRPRVWINVTTSANWNRPAVGIVRVERALAEQLQVRLGTDRCRLCVWQDGRFIEWIPGQFPTPPGIERAVDALLPRTPSFDLARSHVARALERLLTASGGSGRNGELRFTITPTERDQPSPLPGDFLISAGLDWDHPYSREFHALATRQGLRIITCCYDLIPVLFPQYCVGDVARHFTEYFLSLSWGSEAVMCISRQTQGDYTQLCRELGAPLRQTVVIPLGDNLPAPGSQIGDQVRTVAQSPFILFVSTIERRKNHEVLYRAYHLLSQQGHRDSLPQLVFVGMPGWGIGDLMKDIELDPLTLGKIVQLNHVADGELAWLYERALFCVFPSLYEGWGLPVGEALSMGKAVLASHAGSLPEVGGDLVRYLRPWDPYAWADAILDYVRNPDKVRAIERQVEANYRPKKWADTAAVVESLLVELGLHAQYTMPERRLLPGYALRTECGMSCGPTIRTTGTGGMLFHGPHIAMRRGRYRLQLGGTLLPGHSGEFTVEVRSRSESVTQVSRSRLDPDDRAELLADVLFDLPDHSDDVEFRCHVEPGCAMQVDLIHLSANPAS